MQTKIVLISAFFASLLLLSSIAFADITVQPAKLGIVRITTQPLFPTISQGTFTVGNTYNFSLNVTLQTSQNISSMVILSDSNFTLQPNENKTISYSIKPTTEGVFSGAVVARFTAGPTQPSVAYENDIVIIVSQSNSYILVLAAVAAVLVIVGLSGFVMYNKKRGKK